MGPPAGEKKRTHLVPTGRARRPTLPGFVRSLQRRPHPVTKQGEPWGRISPDAGRQAGMIESLLWTGVDSLINAMSLLRDKKDDIYECAGYTAEGKGARGLPDSIRVPGLVDDDLGGTDGNGTGLISLQIVFSQEDPVGVTAAWAQKTWVRAAVG